ncbi:MAG TPA: sodium:solute symporter family protein [Vicinamibacteria bacterium]|nr:sodium:solute symporter family protein [Vicinamibacteria bacterium]
MSPHLVSIIVYSTVLVLLGALIGRWVRTTGAFFVAGRNLGPVLLFSTLLAANIGAGSTVGAAALGYSRGLSAWWWVGSAGIGTLALAWWVGPRIWRVAKDHDLQTVGDLLELRYGSAVRLVVSSLLWVGTLFVLAAQLLAVARVLEAVAGVPKTWGCLMGGVVMTAYFTAGGLLSSAWVNLVQLVVLGIGFVIAVPVALGTIGGIPAIDPMRLDLWEGGAPAARYLALLVPSFIVSPGLLQKVYGARDERTVRLAVSLAGFALLLFAFLPPLLGMVARVHFPNLSSDDLALPTLLVERMPLALGSLGLAAIFSAEVSSADAILFMLATSLARDLYGRFVRPTAGDAEVLRVARLAAIAGGLLGIGIALLFESVIQTLSIFYALLSVSLFVPVVASLHSRNVGRAHAFGAILIGVPVLVAAHVLTGGRGLGVANPTLLGLAASALGFLAAATRARLRGDFADR